MRTALEQELGLAAYFVSSEAPLEKQARSEALESDAEKLSSTDNEDEELVTEGAEAGLDTCPARGVALGPPAGQQLPMRAIYTRLRGKSLKDFRFGFLPPHFWSCEKMEIPTGSL